MSSKTGRNVIMNDLSPYERMIALFIHVVLPILGIICYIFILTRIKRENVKNPPNIALFLVFLNYGMFLLLILTALFWYWSGMATLGLLFVLFISPLIMLGIAIYYFNSQKASKYHKAVFYLALMYLPILLTSYYIAK